MQDKLREQAHLLETSLDRFYSGDMAEALTVAIRVRTLVHEARKSIPLLKQLNPNYGSLLIRDKSPAQADEAEATAHSAGTVVALCSIGIRMSTDSGFAPFVDFSSPTYEMVPLQSWWKRACLIFPQEQSHAIFSKKGLILILANKEGGAHVDFELPPEYAEFIRNSPLTFIQNGVKTDTVILARYAAGQCGAELLDCLGRNFPSLVPKGPLQWGCD